MESSGMVIDTYIIIDFLRSKNKTNTEVYKIPDETIIHISAVSLYELLMGATDEQKREDVRLITEDLIVLPFDDGVSVRASEIYHTLRKSNLMIEFRDIFIAATCLTFNLPIKTRNRKHFTRISNLQFC